MSRATDAVEAAVERIREGGLAAERPLEGLSEQEIGEVARRQGVRLPAAYLHFLSRLGRSAGDFLRGSDFLYPELLALKEYARELLEEDRAGLVLGDEHFVFFMHQGYQFLYFDTTASDDPPVHLYLEGEGEPEQVADAFSAWLKTAVEEEIEEWAEARKSAD